jgi:acylphosphatase
MADRVRAHVWVSGRVQGVGFRLSAQWTAHSMGLLGWVRNLPDGRVEAVAEGPREKIDTFLRWCHQGPPGAGVSGVQVEWESPQGERGFRIC